MSIVDRFLSYVAIDTTSDKAGNSSPSTKGQFVLANKIHNELKELGVDKVEITSDGYVYAKINSNISNRKVKSVGFISHMDTSPDALGKDIKPRIVRNYDGKDIKLNTSTTLSPTEFSDLNKHIGEDLIVSDGTTLLGADDKSGIAAIITAAETIINNKDIKHGDICIAFTPDEEIGRGADKFDIKKFGAEWAYTIDGGDVGELEYENFNAAEAVIIINGRNVHPGSAKGKMINSLEVASEFINSLPQDQKPEKTEGYEGFFHLVEEYGTVEHTELHYIIRDHDRHEFEQKKVLITDLCSKLNCKYNNDIISIKVSDQYYNMKEKIEPEIEIIETAQRAMIKCGIKPKTSPIRGGTDGAMLSYKGLPCPNIFAGGINFHSRYEFLPIQSMIKAKDVIIEIIKDIAIQKQIQLLTR